MFETISALTLGVSLSACAGLRAIVPLFLLALGHKMAPSWVPLVESLEWMSSWPAVLALGCAAVVEFVADKIPALDNILDVIQTPVRTIAGGIVVAAPLVELPTWAVAIMVIIGAGSAFSVHGGKALLRAASTATTGGLANPIISFLEDIFTWVVALLAIVIPILVFLFLSIVAFFFFRRVRQAWRARQGATA